VCGALCAAFDRAIVLKMYEVAYFRCESCGFIQTEEPYWLGEAYSSAIARQDVGIMFRNMTNCDVTTALLNLVLPETVDAVDFGGGHGVFVRMMRDRGFNFYWSDRYASNDYAPGFEAPEGKTFDFLTAFEVLEHFVDPASGIARLMELSENVLVSTAIVPKPAPRISDWWYFSPSSGQHVSFYTETAISDLARRFGRHVLSSNSYHLFTAKPRSRVLFRLATSPRAAKVINALHRRPSLIESDLNRMTA